jgi:2-keto-4-pentenoate hydratase/2-oxohepta-3-ene-1,7-dioic acid hydratase in catechol pathway
MRIANAAGRLSLVVDDTIVDVESASSGRFSADIQMVYSRWADFREWASSATLPDGQPLVESDLGAPAPRPPQVFAIGLNYREHATESGLELPTSPYVFTKFASAITGPYDEIPLPSGSVDWEAELVAVIGREARHVPAATAWGYVAGLTMGQDLSERDVQWAGPAPQQFNIGKSYPGFAPIGPILVTPDEFDNPDAVEFSCSLAGEQMQKTRTDDMIFSIPAIIAYLSSILTLLPGDVIFTGTPSGIGWSHKPPRWIQAGEELTTRAELIGEMRNRFVAAAPIPASSAAGPTGVELQ